MKYVSVPEELTAENGDKYAFIGEFKFNTEMLNEDGDYVVVTHEVPWDTIKEIHRAIVKKYRK